jgi:hypothetical protein
MTRQPHLDLASILSRGFRVLATKKNIPKLRWDLQAEIHKNKSHLVENFAHPSPRYPAISPRSPSCSIEMLRIRIVA